MPKANEHQVGGEHYRQEYQHWDFAADTPLNYFEANITKYITRWRSKDGVNDVKKAAHYLQKLIEVYQAGRMQLPERVRLLFPFTKFCAHTKLNETERAIFHGILTYTSLQQLVMLREPIEKLLEEANKVTK